MNNSPLISLITINYNGLDLTCALLDSLAANVSTPLEIIVVDNGSERDEAAVIEERYPYVKVIRSAENLGFAGGNNLGAAASTGDFLFFINNDTEILEDGLQAFADALASDPKVGMVCAKIRFYDGTRPIQYAGYTEMKGIAMKNDMVGYMHEDDGSFDTPCETAFAHGCAMMIKREAFEDVGPISECYFLYFEEMDWSLSLRRRGWKILYSPALTVYHKESATTGRESALKTYYMTRSRLMFAYRNFSGARRTLTLLYARILSGGKKIVTSLLHGRRDISSAVLRAWRDFDKMKGELL